MPTYGNLKGPYPNTSAVPDVPGDLLTLIQRYELMLGAGSALAANAAARAALATNGDAFEGLLVEQADTFTVWQRKSSAWRTLIHGTPPRLRVTKSAAQSTPPSINTNTMVAWDQETYDTATMHDNATNNSRFTVPTGGAGYYDIHARIRFNTTSASGNVQVAKNGSLLSETAHVVIGVATALAFCDVSTKLLLADGDYIEIGIQSNTASIPLVVGNCYAEMNYLGAF